MKNRHNLVAVVFLLVSVIFINPAAQLCRAGQTGEESQTETGMAHLLIDGKCVISLVLMDQNDRLTAIGSPDDASVYRPAGTNPRSIETFIDMPAEGEAVSLAPGRYRVNTAKLFEPDKNLKYLSNNPIPDPIDLKANQTTTLKIVAPLRHTVTTGRQGGTLELNYSLLGTAGENYRLMTDSTSAPLTAAAEFNICKAGNELFSGSFRYG